MGGQKQTQSQTESTDDASKQRKDRSKNKNDSTQPYTKPETEKNQEKNEKNHDQKKPAPDINKQNTSEKTGLDIKVEPLTPILKKDTQEETTTNDLVFDVPTNESSLPIPHLPVVDKGTQEKISGKQLENTVNKYETEKPQLIPSQNPVSHETIDIQTKVLAGEINAIKENTDSGTPKTPVYKTDFTQDVQYRGPILVAEIAQDLKNTLEDYDLKRKQYGEIMVDEKASYTSENQDEVEGTGAKGSGSGESLEEFPELTDLFFAGGEGDIESGDPIVVRVDDNGDVNYIPILKNLLRLIYREKRGGKPTPRTIRHPDRILNDSELDWMEAENQIYSLELSEEDWRKVQRNEKVFESMKAEIEDLYSQGYGAIILDGGPNELIDNKDRTHLIRGIEMKPRPLEDEESIFRTLFGGIYTAGKDMGRLFEKHMHEYKQKLKRIGKEDMGLYANVTNQHEGKESELHLLMKQFIVGYLHKTEFEGRYMTPTELKKKVETEVEIDEEVVADVKYGDRIFETETLYSTDREGAFPRRKIIDSFEKYEETSVKEVTVVLDNLTFYRHINTLREIDKSYRSWKKDPNKPTPKFTTLDIKRHELVELDSAVDNYQDLFENELEV